MNNLKSILTDERVYIAQGPVKRNANKSMDDGIQKTDLRNINDALLYDKESIKEKLDSLFKSCGWDEENYGTEQWNPLSHVINQTDKVLIKPNWVRHKNHSSNGLDCLITNSVIIECVLEYVIKAKPMQIIVGDAPIQGCDLPALFEFAGLNSIKKRFKNSDVPISWQDFRRTILNNAEGVWNRSSECRSIDQYYLVDLSDKSLLEPVSTEQSGFRVAMYDPRLMAKTHKAGCHKYLIAREAIEANVIINLPKLKTHAKAGLTGALKNLVGINGSKEYLPHHRVGGSQTGGDCYQGGSVLKRIGEYIGDIANTHPQGRFGFTLRTLERAIFSLARRLGQGINRDGRWYGNDTVWRMCLDLNRILIYISSKGVMTDTPQRKMFTITDAIICGEGEGPLSPSPRTVNILTLANNPAVADFVHAYLMGFDWKKIPIVRESFQLTEYPITNVHPSEVCAHTSDAVITSQQLCNLRFDFKVPEGWQGRCELG